MIDDDLKLGDERTTLMRSSSLILLACYISVEGGVETEHHLSLLQAAASAVRQSSGESEAEAQEVEEQIQADESMEDQPQANIPEDEEPSDVCGSAASMLDARTQLLQEQKDTLNESKATMKQLRQMLKKQEQDLIKDQMNSEGARLPMGLLAAAVQKLDAMWLSVLIQPMSTMKNTCWTFMIGFRLEPMLHEK